MAVVRQFMRSHPGQSSAFCFRMNTEQIAFDARRVDPSYTLQSRIAQHPFFRKVPLKQIAVLADCAMEMEFTAGQLIFHEGDPANRFYAICDGEVVLETAGPARHPIPVQTLGSGDILGWSWMFPPHRWNFDARATKRSKVIFFYATRLRAAAEEDPDLGCELLRRMARVAIDRLQATRRKLIACETK
jgi:CRP/FNR family transcriptional regulator, cyclic AMP receptor protein